MIAQWLKNLLFCLMIACTTVCVFPIDGLAQTQVTAQGIHTDSFGMTLDDAQIASWLGRERSTSHPAIPGLEEKGEAGLHFFFSRAYAQRAQSVIDTAASSRDRTIRFLPKETTENINIYLLGDLNDYFIGQHAPGRAPEWAAGLTLLSDGVILIRLAPRGTSRIEPARTLAHELSHAALRRYAGNNIFPHWFYEGLAMLSTDDWNLNRAESLGKAAMAGQLIDIDSLDAAFGKTGALVDLAYAESAHFVSWLAKSEGDDSIRHLISQVAVGHPFDKAFLEIYRRSPNAAFATWKDNISREKSLLASIFSSDGLFFFISVFAAFGLCFALWRKSGSRKRRLANMNQDMPDTMLPENLRSFGPFMHS